MRPRDPAQDMAADELVKERLGRVQEAIQDMEVDDDGESEKKPAVPAKSEEELLKDAAMAKTKAIFDATILPCDTAYPPPTEASWHVWH